MATKKTATKKTVEVVAEPKALTPAQQLRANYTKLDELNIAVKDAMQVAYRFARDNKLMYVVPSPDYDADDNDSRDRDEWDSSYC